MKKRIAALALVVALIFGLAGCGTFLQDRNKKIEISMYLWDKCMSKDLTPWLEKQFPNINFTFVVGYNSMDFYADLNKRGCLPDIITCRRFSLNDAAGMSDLLMDLSQTELVGSFYDSYIENNREEGGAIRWLPMCAEVDGYIANTALFEKHGIPLPTNYTEFVDVCRQFEQLGIAGYLNDYKEDYSCMEALQGCAIQELMTIEGTMWRLKYENEDESDRLGLDTTVWPKVFEKFERYLSDTAVEPQDVKLCFDDLKDAFLNGRAAIVRGTANDCTVLREDYGVDSLMLPYFGETEADNWLLTYPTCQVAVNKSVQQDKQKTEAVMQVLDAMFSEDGQKMAATNSAILSYNKNVHIELDKAFSQVEDCVNSNHLYIRLASTEMFSVSKNVVQKMISKEYSAAEAYESFNAQIMKAKDEESAEIITTQEVGYEFKLEKNGNPAASSVINTLQKNLESDVAIAYASFITSPIFEGEYTAKQIGWLAANKARVKQGNLTGAEILELMDSLVNVRADGANPIRHKNLLPTVAGIEYTVIYNGDGTYTLETVTINGKPLDNAAVYKVITVGDDNYIEALLYCYCPIPENVKLKMKDIGRSFASVLSEALAGGKQFEAPSEYVSVHR